MNWTKEENTHLYSIYQHTEHDVTIIPEFSPFLTVQIFLITTLLAVIICKRKRFTTKT